MSTFTTHDGVALDYCDRGGDGLPLLMLHGWDRHRPCSDTSSPTSHQIAV